MPTLGHGRRFQTSRDLSVRLAKDRPRDFVLLLETLSGAGVAIEGLTDVDSVVHILAADPCAAPLALREGGFAIDRELEVLVLPVADPIDGVSTILRHLAAAGVKCPVPLHGEPGARRDRAGRHDDGAEKPGLEKLIETPRRG